MTETFDLTPLDTITKSQLLKRNWSPLGLWTFHGGIHFPDNIKATFGNTVAAPDLSIYSDGSDGIIYASTTPMMITALNGLYIETLLDSIFLTTQRTIIAEATMGMTWNTPGEGAYIKFTTGGVDNSGFIQFETNIVNEGGVSGNMYFNIGDAPSGTIGKYIFNDYNYGADLQFKTPTSEYLAYFDTSEDRIGILTDTPAYPLDVNGIIRGVGLISTADVIFSALPIVDPVVAGQLWNNSGTVKVSAG